jgi:hypothetical protein
MPIVRPLPHLLSIATYPLLLTINLVATGFDIHQHALGRSTPFLFGTNVLMLLLLEYFYPMQQRWRMSWHTAKRDLFFMALGILTLIGANWGLTALAIALAPKHGWLCWSFNSCNIRSTVGSTNHNALPGGSIVLITCPNVCIY